MDLFCNLPISLELTFNILKILLDNDFSINVTCIDDFGRMISLQLIDFKLISLCFASRIEGVWLTSFENYVSLNLMAWTWHYGAINKQTTTSGHGILLLVNHLWSCRTRFWRITRMLIIWQWNHNKVTFSQECINLITLHTQVRFIDFALHQADGFKGLQCRACI